MNYNTLSPNKTNDMYNYLLSANADIYDQMQNISPVVTQSTPLMPTQPSMPEPQEFPLMQQGPPPLSSTDYIPGFLASNIGRNVRAEFILGGTQYVDKTGKIVEVGVNFFVLQDLNSRTYVMCDLYSVRFVTFLSE